MKSIKVEEHVWEKLMVLKAVNRGLTMSKLINDMLDKEEVKYSN